MKKIKAVLCDFDGTLVDDEENFYPGTKNQIARIREKNVRFSFATGRMYFGKIQQAEEYLDIKGVHIVHGGATIYDSVKEERLWYQPIPEESLSKVSGYLRRAGVKFAYETEREIYMYPKIIKTSYLKNVIVKNLSDYKGEGVSKLLVFAKLNGFAEEKMDSYIKDIQRLANDIGIIKFNFDGSFGVDITSEKSTKHTAVLEYCKILGLQKDDVVGIGDGYNDYPLLTACGFRIAMGNSHRELKEIADLVVSDVSRGGIKEAFDYIIKNLI